MDMEPIVTEKKLEGETQLWLDLVVTKFMNIVWSFILVFKLCYIFVISAVG